MIYRNIEIHNVGQIQYHDDGITWLRVPESVYDELDGEQGRAMCKNAIGVELRFILKGESATITIASISKNNGPSRYQVFYGGIQGGWMCHDVDTYIGIEPKQIHITMPEDTELLQRMSEQAGYDWDPRVIRVIFTHGAYKIYDVQGDIASPLPGQTPKRTLLCYGSSITHGANCLAMPDSWPSVVAHEMNMDLINLGMAGSCRMEPAMVEYLATGLQWDIAILELGINVLEWNEETIRERVLNTLDQIAGKNIYKPVYVISPLYSDDDFNGIGLAKKWRMILSSLCEQEGYPNITYIDGLDILGDMSYISADGVHPNIYGTRRIATRLLEIMTEGGNNR